MIFRLSFSILRRAATLTTRTPRLQYSNRYTTPTQPFAAHFRSLAGPLNMSDSESQDDFRMDDDSGSEGYAAAPKTKKAAPVKKAAASSSKPPKVSFWFSNTLTHWFLSACRRGPS